MSSTRVLIVDDNKSYRDAFRRNLLLRNYEVEAAEDAGEAMDKLHGFEADVVVTDLAMRHATEGLDLIRQARALRPHLPIIMISAVGTFDEGAEAIRLGAAQVISKSRIDEEMKNLHAAIDNASAQHARVRELQAKLMEIGAEAAAAPQKAETDLNEILRNPEVPASVKGEAYDLLIEIQREPIGAAKSETTPAEGAVMEKVEGALNAAIPGYPSLDDDTRQNLRTAEFLFQQGNGDSGNVDFSRSMGFAYCFAVENEAKSRLRKRLHKFLGDSQTVKLVESLLEKNRRSLSVFYQQYLLRVQKGHENEAVMENFFQVFLRILEHQSRYKPDGLKALGIMLICFGREYTFKFMNKDQKISNPLDLKGLDSDDEVMELAALLINLQHYRNPYIHPEISEMTKLSKIRETAFACLHKIAKLQP